jgi:hypothetical protein
VCENGAEIDHLLDHLLDVIEFGPLELKERKEKRKSRKSWCRTFSISSSRYSFALRYSPSGSSPRSSGSLYRLFSASCRTNAACFISITPYRSELVFMRRENGEQIRTRLREIRPSLISAIFSVERIRDVSRARFSTESMSLLSVLSLSLSLFFLRLPGSARSKSSRSAGWNRIGMRLIETFGISEQISTRDVGKKETSTREASLPAVALACQRYFSRSRLRLWYL